MSEKRVFVAEIGLRNCPLMTFDNICVLDKNCEDKPCEAGITRSEAIEKMAKAICRTAVEDCETCIFDGHEKDCKQYLEVENYITYAEAALDALLGGKQ
ncbi:hypothetical protein [Candidatus Avelusimicrobium alvi]|uniref:hypothetical protein n=1 Tax=Candidatus Avelusimicrobium alvi TaxID=3416221 RepID=UPI003D0F5E41